MTEKNHMPAPNQRRRIASLAAAAAAIGMTIGISPAQALGMPAAADGMKAATGAHATTSGDLEIAQAIGIPKPGAKYPKIETPGASFPKVERPGAKYPKVEIRPGAKYPKVEISPVKG